MTMISPHTAFLSGFTLTQARLGLCIGKMSVEARTRLSCFLLDEVNIDSIGHLHTACTIKGDLSAIQSLTPTCLSKQNVAYKRPKYDIVIWFGGPEMKAQYRWKENVGENQAG